MASGLTHNAGRAPAAKAGATITLLRYISEPALREEITAATNKVEAYNGFSGWLMFGNDVIGRNDPAEQGDQPRGPRRPLSLHPGAHQTLR